MPDTLESTPAGMFSRWNHSAGKRAFDLVCAGSLLLLISPLLLVVALAVKCTTDGPIFFRHHRVGKNGSLFDVLKFRTMSANPQQAGPNVTRSGDPRITSVGKLLRKWKLDELPQLINVVRGEMSLVGPRPDAPQYIRELSPQQKQVLMLSPGITGAASLRYRDEETVLSRVPANDLEHFYCTELLPAKVRLDTDYAHRANFLTDFILLLRTGAAIFR